MTEEERGMLRDVHQALFAVPPGSSKDAQPLIVDLRRIVKFFNNASWGARAVIFLITTVAAVGAGISTIRAWFQ